MKNLKLILSIFILSISFNGNCGGGLILDDTTIWVFDSTLKSGELSFDTSVESFQTDSLASYSEELNEQNPSEPAGYSQLFMFGFLILGAVLVVWKYRGN